MRPGTRSTGFGSPRQRARHARVDDDERVADAPRARRARSCRPSSAREHERRAARPSPRRRVSGPCHAVEVDHRAGVVAVVAQQPPEPLGAAHRPVGDDERRRRRSRRATVASTKPLGRRQRMAAARARGIRELRARRRRTPRPGCGLRGSARRPKSGIVERPASSRRTGSARVTSEHAAAYQGHETVPARSDRCRRRARRDRGASPVSAARRPPAATPAQSPTASPRPATESSRSSPTRRRSPPASTRRPPPPQMRSRRTRRA